jgi:cyclopropane-fatty-acyl-phospholipid synthase
LDAGHSVLDIGSGWGGLGLYLAEAAQSIVTGVTLSQEQYQVSNERAQKRGLGERVRFKLCDYRKLEGPFDRIVSAGMFEHVGIGYYREFFTKCRDLLTQDGVMVLHAIGRFDSPIETNSWMLKYIFPGGHIPSLSEVFPAIEKVGLKVTDVEIQRLHYAHTLEAWRLRFAQHRDQARDLYDERFCRMWEFYLASAETAFRYQNLMVFQIQLTKHALALPLTRNYMSEAEEKLRQTDTKLRPLSVAPIVTGQ